jgi:peptide/nickel transport system substrate-binding protein
MRAASAAACFVLALLSAGCGSDDDGGSGASSGLAAAGGAGTLVYAMPATPATLDPLLARGRAAQTVTRQVHEPMVSRISGPYDSTAVEPGLALAVKPSPDRTVWSLTLRPGVRFQDGTPFNAAAVLANSRRWTTLRAGRKLLPGVFAVDAPRPDEVRFLLDRPDKALARRLASPRLGIVSPRALQPAGGERAEYRSEAEGSGSGPFALAATESGRVELSRNAAWWGSGLGLGPALDGVVFVGVPAAERARLLDDGSAQVADPLGPAELGAVSRDPLLTAIGGPGKGIGLERSVRGFDSARAVPLLSRVWLTSVPG